MRRSFPAVLIALAALAGWAGRPDPTAAQPKGSAGIKVVHRVPVPEGRKAVFAQVAPDGSRFGAGLDGDQVVVWDGKTGAEAYRLPGAGPVFTADGRFVAAYVGSALRAYDPATGREVHHADLGANIWGVLRLPGAARLVAWTEDGRAHVYAAGVGKVLHSWPFYPDSFFAWSPDGNVLFLRHKQGGSYHAYDVRTGKPADGFGNIVKNNRIFTILPGGEQAVVEEGSHSYLVNVKTGERVREVPEIPGPKVVAGGRGNYTGYGLQSTARGRLRLTDTLEGKEVGGFALPDNEKSLQDHTIGLSPDGQFACVATDRSVYLLRLGTPK